METISDDGQHQAGRIDGTGQSDRPDRRHESNSSQQTKRERNMIINGQELIKAAPIKDMLTSKHIFNGVSHGLSLAGYDIRIEQDVFFGEHGVCVDGEWKQGRFTLASAVEEFNMPFDLVGVVHDKSTWARRGLAVFNTVIEPGWRGYLTLELVHHGLKPLHIKAGSGIAQVMFSKLAVPAAYQGKYQDQARGPVQAKDEQA